MTKKKEKKYIVERFQKCQKDELLTSQIGVSKMKKIHRHQLFLKKIKIKNIIGKKSMRKVFTINTTLMLLFF